MLMYLIYHLLYTGRAAARRHPPALSLSLTRIWAGSGRTCSTPGASAGGLAVSGSAGVPGSGGSTWARSTASATRPRPRPGSRCRLLPSSRSSSRKRRWGSDEYFLKLNTCLLFTNSLCLRWGWLPWWSISIQNSQKTQSSRARSQSGSELNLRPPCRCPWATCPRWQSPSSWRTPLSPPPSRATPTRWPTWCRWPRPRPPGPWPPCPSAAGLWSPGLTPLPPSRLSGQTRSMTRALRFLRWVPEPGASLETATGGGWPIMTGATPTWTRRRTSPRTESSTGSRTWGRPTLTQL